MCSVAMFLSFHRVIKNWSSCLRVALEPIGSLLALPSAPNPDKVAPESSSESPAKDLTLTLRTQFMCADAPPEFAAAIDALLRCKYVRCIKHASGVMR